MMEGAEYGVTELDELKVHLRTPVKIIPHSPSSQRLLSPDDSCSSRSGSSRMSSDAGKDLASAAKWRPSGRAVALDSGTEDELTIKGYRYHSGKTFLTGILFVLTAGLTWLMLHWVPKLRLKMTHEAVPLADADTVLVEEKCKAHSRRYVKKVYIIRDGDRRKLPFSMPSPCGGGSFKDVGTIRFFRCKKLMYVWDDDEEGFYRVRGLDLNFNVNGFHEQSGLGLEEQRLRQITFGPNDIHVPDRSVAYLLVEEVLNPFYVFQLAATILWLADEYYYYAVAIIIMSVGGITSAVYQTRQNQKNLRSMIKNAENVAVKRKSGRCDVIDSEDIVPGDVIVIPRDGCDLTCDAVLISGTAIVNESVLTGESVPVTKTTIAITSRSDDDQVYCDKEHQKNTLYRGTRVVQTRNYRDHETLAVVIRTGFSTFKGNLVRSILYPSPPDFKFEQDSYKFVGFLTLVALTGFVYTCYRLIYHGQTSFKEIFLDAGDLLTIVIPPALPAAITMGSICAERRLKAKGIFCISPRTITVTGSFDCLCFDKTGTLTEDGLDLLGVVRSPPKQSDNSFGLLEKEVSAIPTTDDFIRGMATCHSLTTIEGNLFGDPLDVMMFKGTEWSLEEQVEDSSEQYDNLYPTVVKPPSAADHNELDSEADSIAIIRQFQFSSEKQCMSVIVRALAADHFTIYCKGSPEKIVSISDPISVPFNFRSTLDSYAQRGLRIIAVGLRNLPSSVTYRKVQRVDRNEVEKELKFLGLIVFENRLKTETLPVLRELQAANLRTIMITGDHIQTAVSVAKECNMLNRVIFVSTIGNEVVFHEPQREEKKNLSEIDFDYGFAIDGPSFEAIRQSSPHLTQRLCTLGAVFARMNPTHKKMLVEELQSLGYCVGMCGDGANDCGALKAAHAGIALSEAEASVASPFTSKEPNISCVPGLIREGRCALVTSFGIFKYMAAYSLTQYLSVLLLYEIGSNLSDIQFLYVDLFLITTFALFFGMTKAYEGELAKKPPENSLIRVVPIASLLLQLVAIGGFQLFAFKFVQTRDWFVPYRSVNPTFANTTAADLYAQTTIVDSSNACWENYAIFSISAFQYVILAFTFSKSTPYRKPVVTNRPLMASMLLLTGFTVYMVVAPPTYLQYLMELFPPPELGFPLILLGAAVCNAIVCVVLEDVVVEMLLVGSYFSKLFKKPPPHVAVERWLRDNGSSWPPISEPQQALNLAKVEDCDPKVQTKVEFEVMNENVTFDQLIMPSAEAPFKPKAGTTLHHPNLKHSDAAEVLNTEAGSSRTRGDGNR